MGNLLSNPASEADPLDDKFDCGRRSPAAVYNGAQSSGTESAQIDRRLTTPHMPNVLTTPTNLSSPILATGPSAPSAYPTALESTLDVVTEQPTSQMNEADVTPDLFSPTTPEPTIIPETPTIFDTPMDRTPALQSAQLSSDRLPSDRKTREDSPPLMTSPLSGPTRWPTRPTCLLSHCCTTFQSTDCHCLGQWTETCPDMLV